MFVSAISILAKAAARAFGSVSKGSLTSRGGKQSITLDIDEEPLKLFMKQAPKIINQEFNRGFKSTMGVFTRRFSAQAFGKGRINVRRKGKFKSQKGGIFVPLPARKFGFIGFLRGVNRLDGKRAEVRNSARFASAHEYGATINPGPGKKHVIIRLNKRGDIAKARRAGVDIPRGRKPKILKVKKVVIKPRLGFHRTFRKFRWTAITRLNKTLDRAAKRAIQRANRAKSKKK